MNVIILNEDEVTVHRFYSFGPRFMYEENIVLRICNLIIFGVFRILIVFL